jgi:hypothetical protein
MKAAVVHRFDRPGRYAVALSADGKRVVSTSTVYVDPPPSHERARQADAGGEGVEAQERRPTLEPPRPGADPSMAVHLAVDVSRPEDDRPDGPKVAGLLVGGYASFTAPTGGGHHVRIHRVGPSGQEELEFDISRLRGADTFACNPLRPGAYAMRDLGTGHEGRLQVSYPVVGRSPYQPGEPAQVTCGGGGFEPAQVVVGPAQGVVFTITGESRIVVELVEPDDGPAAADRRPVARRTRRTLRGHQEEAS